MIGDILQCLLLFFIVVVCSRYALRTENNLFLIFAALSAATLLLSTLYWVAHSLLREGMRIPFAANDVADFGTFLLLSASLYSAVGTGRGRLPGVTAAAAAFALVNIGLWIGWSGEWLRDILGGIAFGYFVCVCVRSVYLAEALERGWRIALWAISWIAVAVEAAGFFVSAEQCAALWKVGTVVLLLGEILLLIRTLLSLRAGCSAEASMSLSFICFCWSSVAMYMSEGAAYTFFSALSSLHMLLMLLSIRKKVKAA